jgi:hypothetical protein
MYKSHNQLIIDYYGKGPVYKHHRKTYRKCYPRDRKYQIDPLVNKQLKHDRFNDERDFRGPSHQTLIDEIKKQKQIEFKKYKMQLYEVFNLPAVLVDIICEYADITVNCAFHPYNISDAILYYQVRVKNKYKLFVLRFATNLWPNILYKYKWQKSNCKLIVKDADRKSHFIEDMEYYQQYWNSLYYLNTEID